jgi:hypothetical protein
MLGRRARALSCAIAAAAVFALPIAGCGGSDKKDQYKQDAEKAAVKFKASAEKATTQLQGGKDLKGKVPGLVAFKSSVDKLATDLDGLDPPDNVKALNDEAVVELRTLSGDLSKFEVAAKANDQGKAQSLAPKLQADQTKLQATLEKLDAQAG